MTSNNFEACTHSRTVIVGYLKRHGRIYAKQCQDCGSRVGNWIKKDDAFRSCGGEPKNENTSLTNLLSEVYRSSQENERAEWWGNYTAYLNSPEWKRRRSLVLQRANNRCEGCMQNPATQVHHKTYEHVGNEFLWELVAICDECHDRFHGEHGESPEHDGEF